MKKNLLFLMALLLLPFSAAWAVEKALINFPVKTDGTAISGTTEEANVTVNGTALACYKLKNGYTTDGAINDNYIKLSLDGGFKAGDKIIVAGCIDNKDLAKTGTVVIFKVNDNKPSNIKTFENFVNLKGENPVIEEQTYTLESDVTGYLYLGRSGNTATNVTVIKVIRDVEEGGDDPDPDDPDPTNFSKTWNFSNWEQANYTSQTTIEGLTLVATSEKNNITIDGSNKTVDGVKYTQRLKFGGTGNETNGRYIYFKVPGNCKITIVGAHASSSGDDRTLNIAIGSFSNVKAGMKVVAGENPYAYVYHYTGAATTIYLYSANSGINLYAIYAESETPMTITLNSHGLATFYDSQNAYTIPTGMTASYVESINNNKLSQVELDGIIPADCAVILEGTPGNYTLELTDEATDAPTNLLRGSDTAELTTGKDEGITYKFYALSVKNDVVGFYWMAEGGAAFINQAHKAYLAIPATDSNANNSAFILDGTDGIESIATPTTNGPVYNLAGQRVGENYKGVIIVNGKKVMK